MTSSIPSYDLMILGDALGVQLRGKVGIYPSISDKALIRIGSVGLPPGSGPDEIVLLLPLALFLRLF